MSGIDWRSWRRRFAMQIATSIHSSCSATLDLVFPHICVLCGEPLHEPEVGIAPFCTSCRTRLVPLDERICLRCGSPLAVMALDRSACGACRQRRYAFQSAVAYGAYRGTLKAAVLKAKHVAHEPLATALGTLLADACTRRWPSLSVDAVVPMPMHWRRRWRRGTNSAELVAEAVARSLKRPLHRLLIHRRATAKQGMLSPRERFQNVRGAFRTVAKSRLDGARLLLVDDVMTTGATASEAARALRRRGAESVLVAVIARGVGQ